MPRLRRLAVAILSAGIAIIVASPGHGQQGKSTSPYRKEKEANVTGDARRAVNDMLAGRKPFTEKDLPGMRSDLQMMANHLIYRVTFDEYHKQPPQTGTEIKPAPIDLTLDYLLGDLYRYILVPVPGTKMTFEQADYVKEFGAALDKPLTEVLKPGYPDYIRLNAARMLAMAARSGAPAHAPTITKLLSDPKTRPEVLYHAIKAAENLLAAYDKSKLEGPDFYKHSITEPELIAMIKALRNIIWWEKLPFNVTAEKAPPVVPPATPTPATPPAAAPQPAAKPPAATPPAVAPPAASPPAVPPPPAATPPGAKPALPLPTGGNALEVTDVQLTPDQLAVLHYYRRAAIRALARVREPIVTDLKKDDTAYPLFLLAQVAVDDKALPHRPTSDEIGEAVVGLCGYRYFKGVNAEVLTDIVATGVVNFARKKVDLSDDKTIPWKVHAARMSNALAEWKKFAPNSATVSPSATRIGQLADMATNEVLNPIERMGSSGVRLPNLESVGGWNARGANVAMAPFKEKPEMVVVPQKRTE